MLDVKLIALIACPQCRGQVEEAEDDDRLVCRKCRRAFPIRNGVPIMVVGEAVSGQARGEGKSTRYRFRLTAGGDAGRSFDLAEGSCRALGCGEATSSLMGPTIDLALSLDEGTRALVMAYIAKQFRHGAADDEIEGAPDEQLGTFHRQPDCHVHDTTLSRLHAMFFAARGQVGILDLVSREGTYVNGVEIESRLLKPGDVIELGETKIVYEG